MDCLKTDRSFVAQLGEIPEDVTLVAGIINLVHTLGLEATAEGVETAKPAEQLQKMGCNLAQGYYFSKPLPAETMSALLSTGIFHRWVDLPLLSPPNVDGR